MHMADALVSPAVGTTMWVVTAGLIGYCSKKVKNELDDNKIPLMGVVGAFIFAAQMINFTIPVTGSSGHLGGGMILSILLGPHIAFLTMASVLTVQALFFADGGVLALGCNIFNLGFFPCFIAYPMIYKKIVKENPTRQKIIIGSILSAIIGLQMGAFCVVLETVFSGISELPFINFLMLMQPIHLAIGIIEGVVTASVVMFIWNARPEIINCAASSESISTLPIRNVLIGLAAAAIFIGTILSWFASSNPDGLEWAMFKTAGVEELESHNKLHAALSKLQEKTAFLPDYGFKSAEIEAVDNLSDDLSKKDDPKENKNIKDLSEQESNSSSWAAVDSGTSVSGLAGGILTLILAAVIGFILKRRKSES